jgi:hypothetical protein
MKRCSTCQVAKKSSAFGYQKSRHGKMSLRAVCKECRAGYEKKRHQTLSEDQILKRRDNFYQRAYGITLEQYNELFAQQEGKCKVCETHQTHLSKALVVDHCHETLKVRALLCSGCNLALGNVKENPEILIKLSHYIKGHKQ